MSPLQHQLTRPQDATDDGPTIIDIRRDKTAVSLEADIVAGLKGADGAEKTLPTMLLYSAAGLKLFEDITYLDEYYLTNTEIALLERDAAAMAARIPDNAVVLELGSGNLRKVEILLAALRAQGKTIDYYALDLDVGELRRTLGMLPAAPGSVRYRGLHGTYDDGRAWLRAAADRPRCVLWLGSSVGNFERRAAAGFLRAFAGDALRAGSADCMLVAIDGCKAPARVHAAYNDARGVTAQFILAGLAAANGILGAEHFRAAEWRYVGEWNAALARHQAYYVATADVRFDGALAGLSVRRGERVNIEYSYKFDAADARLLWDDAGLVASAQWANARGDYRARPPPPPRGPR